MTILHWEGALRPAQHTSVVDILIASKTAEHGLPKKAHKEMSDVLAVPRLSTMQPMGIAEGFVESFCQQLA